MHIIEVKNNKKHEVSVVSIEKSDWENISEERFAFIWDDFKNTCSIFKLELNHDILGLIALQVFPEEQRIEIKLLASSEENIGINKKYERIAGTLIAFACREAIRNYDWSFPCVSLLPKTELKQHYIEKYGMLDGGRQIYLEDAALTEIIKEYIP